MKLSRKVAAAMLAAALTLSLCVISALPGGQPRMDAMTYNIDTLPARDLRPVVDGPETEADYTPPAQAIHTTAQEEAVAEVSAEAPAPEAPAQEKTESAASAQPSQSAQPASSTSVLAVGVTAAGRLHHAQDGNVALRRQHRQRHSGGAEPGYGRVHPGPSGRLVQGEL